MPGAIAVSFLPRLAGTGPLLTFMVLAAFVAVMFALAWWASNHMGVSASPAEREPVLTPPDGDSAAGDEDL